MKVTILIILFFLLIPLSPILAHTNQKSFEKTVNGSIVDIGYTPDTFSNTPSTFSFNLLDNEMNPKEFSDIWVRIERDGNTVFATSLKKQELGETTMIYSFPGSGKYELFVRYQNGDEAIAETSFTFDALGENKDLSSLPTGKNVIPVNVLVSLVLGILGGVTIAKVIKKK